MTDASRPGPTALVRLARSGDDEGLGLSVAGGRGRRSM